MGSRADAPGGCLPATARSPIETSFAPRSPGAQIVEPVPPLAPSIARLAERHVRQHGPSAPDAIRPHLRQAVRCGTGARQGGRCRRRTCGASARRAAMNWTIERTLSDRDLDEIVAIEQASFSNPWTREMYVRELQNPDVSFLYVLRVPVRASSPFVRSGWSWTRYTSTISRFGGIFGAGESGQRCSSTSFRPARTVAPTARRSKCGGRTPRPAACTSGSASRWRRRARIITSARRKMRLSYGEER